MTRFSVLLSAAALVVAIAAMSAGGSGIRDSVDPDLTAEVEDLVARSLSEYSGLERTPIPPAPVAVAVAVDDSAPGVLTGIPGSGAADVGARFVEDGYLPLTDLDALYGVGGSGDGRPSVMVPAAPPVDLVDPPLVAWGDPPLDIK